MTAILVAQIKLVMFSRKAKLQHTCMQPAVPLPGSALASVRSEARNRDSQRHAGLAAVAIRPIGEHSAAAKALCDKLRVSVVVNQVAGRCDLRSGLLSREVAARVGRCSVKLQGMQRQVFEMRHGNFVVLMFKKAHSSIRVRNARRARSCERFFAWSQ